MEAAGREADHWSRFSAEIKNEWISPIWLHVVYRYKFTYIELFSETGSRSRSEKAFNIPRPPNAFMVFANESRAEMAYLNPQESNKYISKR